MCVIPLWGWNFIFLTFRFGCKCFKMGTVVNSFVYGYEFRFEACKSFSVRLR